VRAAIVGVICACGAPTHPAAPATTTATVPAPIGHAIHDGPPIDPIAALSATDQVSWIVPGPIELELGGASIQAPPTTDPIEVVLVEDRGSRVRVGIRRDPVRFSAWIERARLLSIVTHDERLSAHPGGEFVDLSRSEPIEVRLKPGARVRRLAKKDTSTQVRYSGAVEITGWLPDASLADRAASADTIGRIPTGRRVLMVTPGAVIRSEPRWASRELAVMSTGYFVDAIRDVDDADPSSPSSWVEVSYEDGEVAVHGFVSKHDPPGRVHHPVAAEALGVAPPPPNEAVADGTCLYGREDGDPIGYVVGDRQAYVEPSTQHGWSWVTLDTPWGPVAFAAKGGGASPLATCGPPPLPALSVP
jgi:hypothetical protein